MAKSETNKDKVFIIMPFGGYFDVLYKSVLIPAINEAGLDSDRADNLDVSASIVDNIWKKIKEAKLIIAILTGQNPNVFYELGLAHASSKPAILVAQNINEVPFDFRHLKTFIYDREDPEWGKKLQAILAQAIKSTVISPLDNVLPTFLSVKQNESPLIGKDESFRLETRQQLNYLVNQFNRLTLNILDEDKAIIDPGTILDYTRAIAKAIEFRSEGNDYDEISYRLERTFPGLRDVDSVISAVKLIK